MLEREGDGVALLGYGVSSDGYHMSAPHPQGEGAIAAMRTALSRAGLAAGDIDYVNLHGTGTRANDAMEDIAVAAVFGDGVPCSSTKGWTGHTLGAAAVTEALIAALCIEHGLMPGCLNMTAVDPAFTTPRAGRQRRRQGRSRGQQLVRLRRHQLQPGARGAGVNPPRLPAGGRVTRAP